MAEAVAELDQGPPVVGDRAEELRRTRLVIGASSAGTVFEWYDFFIYGTLAASGIIGRTFFPSGNETLQTLLAWAGFAVGFGFRPLGAILFGYMGDRLGRKTTFLVTITLMGVATAGVGLVPSAAAIGIAAPILIILLRICQGLALGGEYGGAAIYVAEHSPPGKSGFYTSFIQASVVGGFVLSLAVVLGTKWSITPEAWDNWGWRFPFLFSILLLAVSLWMRLKLSESPVFKALKEEGGCAANPFKASFTYPGNPKRLFVALFGIAAGLTVIWYTAMFSTLSLLQNTMRVDATTAQIIVAVGALLGCGWYILFGWLSDKVGRKRPIVIGYALTLLLLFPIYWAMGSAANPGRAAVQAQAPVTIHRSNCDFDAFAARQADLCGQIVGELGRLGVQYGYGEPIVGSAAATGTSVDVGLGDQIHPVASADEIKVLLEQRGYRFDSVVPSPAGIAVILLALLAITALSGMTYGPVAALLAEMFPPQIRYSSMSIPYHFGTGYFGGFQPFIASYIAASTGDPYSGLWYTWAVVAMALIITLLWLPNDSADKSPA
ncbi:MAG TPA: MFS transporter [Allosphingosinicella sp.]|nr:MFS transporter [Allosphingosinicella sp.]